MNTPTPSSLARFQRVVGQLREIMERATMAPWEVVARPWATDSGHKCTEWNISTAWIHGQLKDKAGIVSRSIHCTSDERNQHGVWLTKEDADFIVAAANSFPALLAIAEAAAVVSAQRYRPNRAETSFTDPIAKAEIDLRTALSLLPNPRGLPPGVPATPNDENQSPPGRPAPSCSTAAEIKG